MRGCVDNAERALIDVSLRATSASEFHEVVTWIDTAFNGELVVPRSLIESLQLPQPAAIAARLADGTEVVLETYHCEIQWFGVLKTVEVVANDGKIPLLGTGLLKSRRLIIDYGKRTLTLK